MSLIGVRKLPLIVPRRVVVVEQPAFVFSINTANTSTGSTNSDQFKLPIYSGGTYDFHVDWGDGNSDDITAFDDAAVTHTYETGGVYTVTITGTLDGWRFVATGDRLKILDVSAWGPLRVGSLGQVFRGCANLTCSATDVLDLTGETSITQMFRNCTNFNGDVSQWDVSSISNFSLAFVEVAAFAGDLTLWDVSGATNMQSMLSAPAFPSQDLSGWDVSGVTNMQEMFRDTNFNSASITGWDVGSVSNMIGMFRGSNDFDQDISGWDFSSVTSMSLFLSDGALSTANYDALLISLAGQTLQSGVNFHAGSSMYSAGAPADARASIISTYGWTIADGGPA